MRSLTSNLRNHYAQEVTTTCGFWKIRRKDGVEFGFTDHPESIDYDGLTYEAASGFYRTALEQTDTLAINNLDLIGLIDSSEISERDLLGGLFYDAQAWYFEANYTDISQGIARLEYGYLGEIDLKEGVFSVQFRSLTQRLDQSLGNKYGRYCRHTLGDSKCGVDLDPDVWTADTYLPLNKYVKPSVYNGRIFKVTNPGTTNDSEGEPTWNTTIGGTTTETDGVEYETVDSWIKEASITSVTDSRTIVASSLTQANGWFKYGILTFVDGLNAGLSFDIKYSESDGTIYFLIAVPFTMSPGNQFTISAGCNRMLRANDGNFTGDCKVKFDNVLRFGGECEIPGQNKILAGKDG